MARKKKKKSMFESVLLGCLAGIVEGCVSRPIQSRYGSIKSLTKRKKGQAHYW